MRFNFLSVSLYSVLFHALALAQTEQDIITAAKWPPVYLLAGVGYGSTS